MKQLAHVLLWCSRWMPATVRMRWRLFRMSLVCAPHVTEAERARALQWWDMQKP